MPTAEHARLAGPMLAAVGGSSNRQGRSRLRYSPQYGVACVVLAQAFSSGPALEVVLSWEESYTGHPLWAAVDAALASLDTGCEQVPDFDHAEADRVRFVLNYVKELGESPQPLVSQATLDGCRAPVVTLTQVLDQWRVGQEPSLLSDAASNRVDAVLDSLRGWPVAKDRYAKGVIAAAEGFVEASHNELDTLRGQVAGLNDELTSLREQLEADRAAAAAAATAVQQQVTAVETATDKQTTRLDDALNGLQATFATAEAERAAAHTTAMTEQAKEAADQRSDMEEDLDQDRAKWAGLAQGALDDLGDLKKQAESLVNAVGLSATSTEYGKYAEQERKAANFWRWVAAVGFIAAFAAFLVMLLTGFGGHITGDTPWQVVVFKVTGSAGLLALGVYASRESSSHRKAERSAKSIQLDLAALEPFIANMSEEDKSTVRLGAALRLFVPPSRDAAGLGPVEASEDAATDALTRAAGL